MAAFSSQSSWEEGSDRRGDICWRNKVTGQIIYRDPQRVGLAVAPSPNSHQLIEFFPKAKSIDSVWDEYIDPKSKNPYWVKRDTKEATWIKPKPAEKQKPPSAKPKVEKKREHELWHKINDPKKGQYWYNEKTGTTQVDRPECCKKYK